MEREELKRGLRNAKAEYAGTTYTGGLRVDFMAADCLSTIEELEADISRLQAERDAAVENLESINTMTYELDRSQLDQRELILEIRKVAKDGCNKHDWNE